MKCIVLYPYPLEYDGTSLQGDLLYRGLLNSGVSAIPCSHADGIQKNFFMRKFKPDVAFGIGFWGNVPDILITPRSYGVTPVPWFNADGWVANYQEEFSNLDLMFTTSEWVRQTYKRDNVDISKIIPMHIGIDTDLFVPTENVEYSTDIRAMFGIKDDDVMILTVGGDVTSKGAQEMMRALAEVDKEFKNWKYVCKSWPSRCAQHWRKHEMRLAKQLGIEDKVIFIHDRFSQDFMVHLLNAIDIYAAPSRLEGFGMVQVEAMSCGKPVISINKMGPSETIVHNETGFLANVGQEILLKQEWVYPWMGFKEKRMLQFETPKAFGYRADINELRDYTLRLLADKELRERMGKRAREHAVKNLDYRDTARKMYEITREKLNLE